MLVVANGAEQVDSGWAVSARPKVTFEIRHADPEQQLLLNDLLQQTRLPLIQGQPTHSTAQTTPTALTGSKSTTSELESLRIAVRPDGVEGWKPAPQPVSPPAPKPIAPQTAPQLQEPKPLTFSVPAPTAAERAAETATPIKEPASDATEVSEQPAAESNQQSVADAATKKTCEEPGCDGDTVLKWSPTDAYSAMESAGDAAGPEGAVAGDEVANEESAARITDPLSESGATLDEVEKDSRQPTGETPADQLDQQSDDGSSDAVVPEHGPAESRAETNDTPAKNRSLRAPEEPVAPPPLTRQLTNLRTRLRSVLKGYYRKQLNSRDNDPWEVMHGMLAYGVHSRIRQGGSRGAPVTSVGWLCYNKPCKNLTLMYVTPKGELRAKYGVGLQGHLGQLLAMLAQCRVSEDYPIRVGKREFTIRDLIEAEKKTCYPKSELTFKLIALQYYLDLNETWVNDQGVEWDFPRLIREELAQPIRGAACGGTHRLSGLSLTVKNRIRRGEPLDGEYERAHEFVQKHHRYAFGLQNRDGSLSTSWFRGRGDDSDINRRIKTTGHILEWLCYSLSDEELRQPRTIAAVTYLTNLMYSNYDNEWEVGPMCHATHALLLYDERVFQPFDGSDYTATYKPRAKSGSSAAKRAQVRTVR